MNDPIFRQVATDHPFTALPTTYTDRFTPEVARQQGFKAGWQAALQEVISMAEKQSKPTKQLTSFLAEIERLADESW